MRSIVVCSTTPTATPRAAQDQSADAEAVVVIDELGVVDAEEGGVGGEHHACRDDGAGQAAAAHFVGACDAAKTRIAEPALDR